MIMQGEKNKKKKRRISYDEKKRRDDEGPGGLATTEGKKEVFGSQRSTQCPKKAYKLPGDIFRRLLSKTKGKRLEKERIITPERTRHEEKGSGRGWMRWILLKAERMAGAALRAERGEGKRT